MRFNGLRQAARGLAHRPSFALLAIATLALGLGATTALFSAFYRLTIQPLPYEGADRIVFPFLKSLDQGISTSPDHEVTEIWREQSRSLEAIAVFSPTERTLLGIGEAEMLKGTRASADLPAVLRTAPMLGRMFTAAEQADNAKVVVLSESLWRSRFGADRGVLGRSIRLDSEEFTVIGVVPRDFGTYDLYTGGADFWIPFHRTREYESGMPIARLRDGVSRAAAVDELTRLAGDVATPANRRAGSWGYALMSVREMSDDQTSRALPVLLGAVLLVLLIACANVAGLLMVRLGSREREIAIRMALGAGRVRILGTLALEQILLGAAAGGVGLLVAAWSITLIRTFGPADVRLLSTISLEPQVLLFALALIVATTLLFGVLPAISVLRRDASAGLRGGGARVTSRTRARSVLVTAQIALSVTLLVGAVLLMRSFDNLRSTDLGFTPDDRLVVELQLPQARYAEADAVQAFNAALLEHASKLPGVLSAGIGGGAPPQIGMIFGQLRIQGAAEQPTDVSYLSGTLISPGFLESVGARFIQGDDFRPGAEDEVIVNRAFAERFWPDGDAVGRFIKLGPADDDPWIRVAGVIENMRVRGPRSTVDELQAFVPLAGAFPSFSLVLHTDGRDPARIFDGVRTAMRELDRDIAPRRTLLLADALAEATARERFITGLLVCFATMALVLTAVGLYGLIGYTVQQRTREVGVRIALGATPGMVRSLFLEQGTRLTVIGVIAGTVAAAAAARLLAGLLYGTTPYDGVAFATAVFVTAATALLASWLPARRAARVDPLPALRAD